MRFEDNLKMPPRNMDPTFDIQIPASKNLLPPRTTTNKKYSTN